MGSSWFMTKSQCAPGKSLIPSRVRGVGGPAAVRTRNVRRLSSSPDSYGDTVRWQLTVSRNLHNWPLGNWIGIENIGFFTSAWTNCSWLTVTVRAAMQCNAGGVFYHHCHCTGVLQLRPGWCHCLVTHYRE